MSERDEGKIALEEHFYLPSFEAHGADGSALDGAGKAHNYDPEYFGFVQKRLSDVKLWLEDMDRGGIEGMVLTDAAKHSGHTGSRSCGRYRKANERRLGAYTGGTSEPVRGLCCCGAPGRARRWRRTGARRVAARFQGGVDQRLFEYSRHRHRPIPRRAASMGLMAISGRGP